MNIFSARHHFAGRTWLSRIALTESAAAGLLLGAIAALLPAQWMHFFTGESWSDTARSWPAVGVSCVASAASLWLVARVVLDWDDALALDTSARLGGACAVLASWAGALADHLAGDDSSPLLLEGRSAWVRGGFGMLTVLLAGALSGMFIGWLGRRSMHRHRHDVST